MFDSQAEALCAELDPRSGLAASLLLQRKRIRRPDLWLQRGHHASTTRYESAGNLKALAT